jgi:hypothetical protein
MSKTVHHSGSPIIVTVNPGGFHVPSGLAYSGQVKVTNDGRAAVKVTPSTIKLTGNHGCLNGSPPWLTVSTKPFTLGAGKSSEVHFQVHSVASGDGAIVAQAAAVSKAAGQAAGAVGARVKVGTGAQTCNKPISAPATHGGGPPIGLLILIAVLAAALVAGFFLVVRRMRREGSAS